MLLKPFRAAVLLLAGSSLAAIDPEQTTAQLLLQATKHIAAGQGAAALEIYDAVLARDTTDYLTLYKRATAYLVLSQPKRALDDFEAVLKLTEFDQARIQIVKLRLKTGDLEAAKSTLSPYLASHKKDATALTLAESIKQADLYVSQTHKFAQQGKWEACISNANAAIEIVSQSSALREARAECHAASGNIQETIGDLSRAASLNPSSSSLLLRLSLINYFYGEGETQLALNPVKQCLHFDPDSGKCKKWVKAFRKLEKEVSKARNFIDGARWASAANLLDPRGEKIGLVKQVQSSLEGYISGAEVPKGLGDQKSRLLTLLMGWACKAHLKNGSTRLAVGMCEQVLKRDPDNVDGLVSRGEELMRKEEWEEANRVLSDAFEKSGRQDRDIHESLQKAQRGLKRSKSKDYYKVLGVASDADERTIKKAYRKAVIKNHPDKGGSQAAMSAVNEAYEVLSNPELRARFDRGDDPNDSSGGGQHPFQQGGSQMFHQFFQQQAGSQHGGGHRFGGGQGQQFHFQWG